MDTSGTGEYVVVCREIHFKSEPPLVLLQNKNDQYAWGREDLIAKHGVSEQEWVDLQEIAQVAVHMIRPVGGSYNRFGLALANFVGEARYTLAALELA